MKDSATPWIARHKNILMLGLLTLLIVSMLGPWMFDVINVPAKYECSPPNIRLYGDFCGMPVSGVRFFGLFVGGFFQMLFELLTGTFINRSRELLVSLLTLPLIPFFTTTLFIWKKETPCLQIVNLVAWTLAFLLTCTVLILQINFQAIRLWGLWLYAVTAFSAIILDIILFKGKTKEEQTSASPV